MKLKTMGLVLMIAATAAIEVVAQQNFGSSAVGQKIGSLYSEARMVMAGLALLAGSAAFLILMFKGFTPETKGKIVAFLVGAVGFGAIAALWDFFQ